MLCFDATDHRYSADGRTLASSTQILRAVGLYSDYAFTDGIHRFRGSAVHECCRALDASMIPAIDAPPQHAAMVDDILNGYCAAFLKWRYRTGFQGICWECPLICADEGYGVTFDVVGHFNGNVSELGLVELKSGAIPLMVPVQLASQEFAIRRGEAVNPDHPGWHYVQDAARSGVAIKKMAVRLEKSGRDTTFTGAPDGTSYDAGTWSLVWRSALNLYTARSKYGLLEKK